MQDLLVRAGYDKVTNGFDRDDQIEQGDFIFRGVKGADAIATQLELFQETPIGMLMGSDVLAEGDILAFSLGVRSDIQKFVDLGIGECRMRFLVPNESQVETPEDLEARLIFSKYSGITRRALASLAVGAFIRQTQGADTRVNDWRQENQRVGAFEIVGSGDTARQNNLQIVEGFKYPTGEALGLPYLDLNRITTDMYVSNIQNASTRSRNMIREIGLALESARTVNRFVMFQFNALTSDLSRFADLGMKGPTVSPLVSGDESWSAVTISVPEAQQNAMRMTLLARGAKDLLSSSPLNAEPDAERSSVIRLLPFSQQAEADVCGSQVNNPEMSRQEAADWLLSLFDTVRQRAEMVDESSSTARALRQGSELCAARYVGEVGELSKAIRTETMKDAIAEAGQCFYWFMVALQSKGYSFDEVLTSLLAGQDQASNKLCTILLSIEKTKPFVGSGGIAQEAVAYADDAITFSTALRKKSKDEALRAAGASLQKLLSLLKIADIDLAAVMEAERA